MGNEHMGEDIVSSPDFSDNEGKYEATTPYVIEKLHDHDSDGLVSSWKLAVYRFSPYTTLLTVISSIAFYGFRIYCVTQAQKKYQRPYIVAWVFVFTEACLLYPQLLQQLFQVLSLRTRRRPKLRLTGNSVPTVDILVVCCNEDIDVILDTVRSACLVDYPRDKFRVAVGDDGKDADLKKAVEALSKIYPNLYYNARVVPKGTPHNFKAGNLRAGTEFLAQLPGGPAEYLAGLDADMIASPDWIRASLPHMVNDPKVALACPPQLFYNIPLCDPLTQSTLSFSHVTEQTKDSNGVAWHTGSGYVLRLEALKSINGWPIASLNEDTLTSTLLLGAGWKTAYIHEPLQIGLIPDTLTGHLKQRMRWSLGNLQTAKHLKCCLYGPLTAQMAPLARFSSWLIILDTCSKIFLVIALLAIPSVLYSGGTLVAYATHTQLRWLLRLSFIGFLTAKLNDAVTYLPSSYRLAQRESAAQLWMSVFYVRTHLISFVLPTWLGGKPLGFDSSGSVSSGLNERDPAKRAPLLRRVKVMMWDCGLWFHALYIPFMLGALAISIWRGVTFSIPGDRDEKLIYLLTHAFWPPLVWLNCLTACVEVVRYVIWPSDMVDREELITRDKDGRVTLDLKFGKGEYVGLWGWWYEVRDLTLGSYLAILFAGTFVY